MKQKLLVALYIIHLIWATVSVALVFTRDDGLGLILIIIGTIIFGVLEIITFDW